MGPLTIFWLYNGAMFSSHHALNFDLFLGYRCTVRYFLLSGARWSTQPSDHEHKSHTLLNHTVFFLCLTKFSQPFYVHKISNNTWYSYCNLYVKWNDAAWRLIYANVKDVHRCVALRTLGQWYHSHVDLVTRQRSSGFCESVITQCKRSSSELLGWDELRRFFDLVRSSVGSASIQLYRLSFKKALDNKVYENTSL